MAMPATVNNNAPCTAAETNSQIDAARRRGVGDCIGLLASMASCISGTPPDQK
jgi:hypothetical protein